MVIFGTLGLVVLCIEKLWIGIMFAFLQLAGIILWTVKLIVDKVPLDSIFVVPLSYSVLTLGILTCHLIDLAYKNNNRPRVNQRKAKERK